MHILSYQYSFYKESNGLKYNKVNGRLPTVIKSMYAFVTFLTNYIFEFCVADIFFDDTTSIPLNI